MDVMVVEVVVAVRVVDESVTAQLPEILLLLLVLLLMILVLLLLLMILFTMLCLLRSLLPPVPVTLLRKFSPSVKPKDSCYVTSAMTEHVHYIK